MLVNILIKKKPPAPSPLETLICIHFHGSRPESTKKMKNVSNILIKKTIHSPLETLTCLYSKGPGQNLQKKEVKS